ncbi:MAG: hypothetical protein R3E01_01275 [Pirellulaceae bacterium]|nr:hypothetical protein [Planctomycetales bacterium]
MKTTREFCIVAACVMATTLTTTVSVAQVAYDAASPLVQLNRVPINTGFPPLNLGFPERDRPIINPDVIPIVRLAQGFVTPDFTYAFTHPLAKYLHPLAPPGQYGTWNSSVYQTGTIDQGNVSVTARSPFQPATLPYAYRPSAEPITFLPNPWSVPGGGKAPRKPDEPTEPSATAAPSTALPGYPGVVPGSARTDVPSQPAGTTPHVIVPLRGEHLNSPQELARDPRLSNTPWWMMLSQRQ